MPTTTVADRLTAHLREQLGAWPPTAPVVLATSAARHQPGWDGTVRRFLGVRTPEAAVLSLPERTLRAAAGLAKDTGDLDAIRLALEPLVGGTIREAAFRWCEHPADLPELGEWVPADDTRLPDWLRPFGGPALVAWGDDGRYRSGVGLKRHDAHAAELAVGTEQAARGLGLGRRLVATAARTLLTQGKVPLYLHALDNARSARVADAAGFPDRGWRLLFVTPVGS